MSRQDKNILGFLVALVTEFANRLGIPPNVAYNYIREFHGLEYYFKHCEILHTLSFEENVGDMIHVCANHGGQLRLNSTMVQMSLSNILN